MPNDDTIKLLIECNSGIRMGVDGINEVIDHVESKELLDILNKYLKDHKKLGDKTHEYLNKYHDDAKDPNPLAKAMSVIKVNLKMIQANRDEHIADLMTDGCNMGIKSIAKYLNKYPNALDEIKSIAYDVIKLEENFQLDLRKFL